MKIIQVMPNFGLAGAEIMCENLIYELRNLGHEVIVISLYNYHSAITDRLDDNGVDTRYLNKRKGLDISIVWKLKSIFTIEKPDVLHTHRYCAQYAMPAAILAGVKHRVHTIHSVAQKENGKLARKLNKFFFKYCQLIPVALSKQIRKSIMEEYHIAEEKIPTVFNGVDLSKCKPKTNYTVSGNFKILHVGRFCEPKNHDDLLKAFCVFHGEHPNSELWLIGDGEKRTDIEEYVAKHDLTEAVKFLGLQSDVYGYLHNADIFTLPSHYEGVPMSLIEAMGTGLPIVATNVGGIPDMLDTESALLVPVDSNAIAKAFESYYKNMELRQWHGRVARERSVKFGALNMAQEYERIYMIKCG